MKRKIRLLPGIAVALLLTVVPAVGQGTGCGPFCHMRFKLYNAGRQVDALWLANECPGDPPHDAPFGNWMVASGWSSPNDGNQFQGWHKKFSLATLKYQWHWNSCTSRQDLYPIGDSTYYNAPSGGYYTQITTKGLNDYTNSIGGRMELVSCPFLFDEGGCAEFDLGSFDLYSEWLDLYENDPGSSYRTDPDAFVDRLTVSGTISAWPLNCDQYGCSSLGLSFPRLAVGTLLDIYADVFMDFIGGEFVDPYGLCENPCIMFDCPLE